MSDMKDQIARREPINQCDGCRMGAPLNERGNHVLTGFTGCYPGEVMGCTANRYRLQGAEDGLAERLEELHADLMSLHRGWCNFCQGDASRCSNAAAGHCTLNDYLKAREAAAALRQQQPAAPSHPQDVIDALECAAYSGVCFV